MPDATAQSSSAALERLVGVLCADALFVLATEEADPKDALEGLTTRRAAAYTAALLGQPCITADPFEPWLAEMARALAPVSPPASLPMMQVVREKVTLEVGARGLRSLFSSKPSEKEVTRVRRYGSLAVRALRAVFAADGPLNAEERATIAAVVAALGLPEADANALNAEAPVSADTLDVYGDMDSSIAWAIVRGAWLAAAADGIDPREEQVIKLVAHKIGTAPADVEQARREAQAQLEARSKTGAAAVDCVRFVLSDRCPGLGVRLAALVGTLMIPRRWRDEALASIGLGAPVTLAKRHDGLDPRARAAVLRVAWAAALMDDPSVARRALLAARLEQFAHDLGEDDSTLRDLAERWIVDALAGAARTLK
jgi:tellurite resistance protein